GHGPAGCTGNIACGGDYRSGLPRGSGTDCHGRIQRSGGGQSGYRHNGCRWRKGGRIAMSNCIVRVAQGKNTTLSHLYIGGLFCCYLLEDSLRPEKVGGHTAIPAGKYRLRLNTWAGMNVHYQGRYPKLHRGMVEIVDIPDFSLVFIHIGNYHTDTAGCPLTGSYWQLIDGDYRVLHSAAAYKRAYAQLLEAIDAGDEGIV